MTNIDYNLQHKLHRKLDSNKSLPNIECRKSGPNYHSEHSFHLPGNLNKFCCPTRISQDNLHNLDCHYIAGQQHIGYPRVYNPQHTSNTVGFPQLKTNTLNMVSHRRVNIENYQNSYKYSQDKKNICQQTHTIHNHQHISHKWHYTRRNLSHIQYTR